MSTRPRSRPIPRRPAPPPAAHPADWRALWALCAGAGWPMAQSATAPGVALSSGVPVAVVWHAPPGRDHDAAVGLLKQLLEESGYDLATRGAPGNSYLLVYSQDLVPRRNAQ